MVYTSMFDFMVLHRFLYERIPNFLWVLFLCFFFVTSTCYGLEWNGKTEGKDLGPLRYLTLEDYPNDEGLLLLEAARKEAARKEAVRVKYAGSMVTIPSGCFNQGSNNGANDEKPVHRVCIDYAFAMGAYEVTFAQWNLCIKEGGCHTPDDEGWGRGNRPVINVSYADIVNDFIPWLNKATGLSYRLPSESEWEYAARGGTTTKYWWGNSIGHNNANCDGCGSRWDDEETTPVGSFGVNPFGLYDTAGNVWEWVSDCWTASYNGAPTNGSSWQAGNCDRRVVRGGSWFNSSSILRSANRGRNITDDRSNYHGFRLARTLPR